MQFMHHIHMFYALSPIITLAYRYFFYSDSSQPDCYPAPFHGDGCDDTGYKLPHLFRQRNY